MKAKPESKMVRENVLNLTAPKGKYLYMVLNDGETFTALTGCRVVAAPAMMSTDEIEEAAKGNELDIIVRFEEA